MNRVLRFSLISFVAVTLLYTFYRSLQNDSNSDYAYLITWLDETSFYAKGHFNDSGGVHFNNDSNPVIWVKGKGTLRERLIDYNDVLANQRKAMLSSNITAASWQDVAQQLEVLLCLMDDCMEIVSRRKEIITVALRRLEGYKHGRQEDISDSILMDYYPWTFEEKLCDVIRNKVENPRGPLYAYATQT